MSREPHWLSRTCGVEARSRCASGVQRSCHETFALLGFEESKSVDGRGEQAPILLAVRVADEDLQPPCGFRGQLDLAKPARRQIDAILTDFATLQPGWDQREL